MSRPTKQEFVSSLHAKGFVPDGKGGYVKEYQVQSEKGATPMIYVSAPVYPDYTKKPWITTALLDETDLKAKFPITHSRANATTSLMLPYPPTVNRYLGVTRKGLRFKSKEGKDYCEAVRLIGQAQRIKPVAGKVALTIHLFRPRKSGDLTNFFKVLEDSLEGILYENDRQIVEHHAFLHDDAENPRCHVLCKELPPQHPEKMEGVV
jgi:Holliday junction resolvase RusA-like endonuclease